MSERAIVTAVCAEVVRVVRDDVPPEGVPPSGGGAEGAFSVSGGGGTTTNSARVENVGGGDEPVLYVRAGEVDASADTEIEAFVCTVRGGIFYPCFVRVACRYLFLVRMWRVMVRVPVCITMGS